MAIPPAYPDSRPWTRWWWFSGEILPGALDAQLRWLESRGFGGVEIAWVYPLPGAKPGADWLSREWSALVAHAKRSAASIGLGCDFTFGSLWPFGGSIVTERDAAKTFDGLSHARLRHSWEDPFREPGLLLDHLDREAFARYAKRMGVALAPAMAGRPSGLFCDSFEVPTEGLWTKGLDERFRERFGYDLRPLAGDLDGHPDVRYDYRALIADALLDEFYVPFASAARDLGGFSRVQAHGAPTDLLAAYASADVPESEAVLFDPPFSRFAASAAATAGLPLVSAEAFTCLYGWEPRPGPGPHQGEEDPADLRLLADALFANGVNHLVWHGTPENPPGGTNRFYASVHVGPDAAFAAELPSLNAYFKRVCGLMRRGRTWRDLGVYLPLEDQWMRGELPEDQRRPSARYHWELQTVRVPRRLEGYGPIWVSARTLPDADVRRLFVDVEWLSAEGLASILARARDGLPVCMSRRPREPGRRETATYERDLDELLSLENVGRRLEEVAPEPPLLLGESLPEFWCREDGDELLLFFAHPATRGIAYPMSLGQARGAGAASFTGRLNAFGRSFDLRLQFPPGRSIAIRVRRDGKPAPLDLGRSDD